MELSNNCKNKNHWFNDLLKNLLKLIFISLPFVFMEATVRLYAHINITYSYLKIIVPVFIFSASWLLLIAFVIFFLNRFWGRILYAVSFLLFFVLFLTHLIYHNCTGFFFSFKLLSSADEGRDYIWETVKGTSPYIFIISLIILITAILVFIKFPKKEKINFKGLLITIILFVITNTLTPITLGNANDSLEWDTWRNPRNVYDNFNDTNKCLKICGLYEYTIKDFCSLFNSNSKRVAPTEEELEYLDSVYKFDKKHQTNDKTGIFKGKNIIFLQFEGVDSWLLTPENMPNTYSLLSNSINFTNHYSYYSGGGSTFNSEIAVDTGFISPISYPANPYAFDKNKFEGTLPMIFKSLGYGANVFHMNTGEFYNRRLNYSNWQYDNYFSLLDDCDYDNTDYRLDTELINNEYFYNNLFKAKQPFLHYIITYTIHTPFNFEGKGGIAIAKKLYGENTANWPNLSEEEVVYLYANETDAMVGLLIKALKDNDLYENTVIVAFADHYLYTLNDKSILEKHKDTSNKQINRTPFFIWSHDLEPETIDKVNAQIDILPTILNMMGIEFYDDSYIGSDIFDKNYKGYVFFSDYSWYDGTHYVEDGVVKNTDNFDKNYINEINTIIHDKIRKNDLTLKFDYFRLRENTP